MLVQTLSQLRELYHVEEIRPFGLLVTARKHRDLSRLSGGLLEDLYSESPLVILRGFDPVEREGLLDFCLRYPRAELLHWDTGPVMEMTPTEEAKNYLFSREEVPLHWDGAFLKEPSFLVFHCLKAPAPDAGGETLFADTTRIWEGAGEAERSAWSRAKLTYRTQKLAHYGGAITVDMVRRHPRTGRTVLRFAEPVSTRLNPVTVEVEGMGEARGRDFVAETARRFYEPQNLYAHRWEDGDYLIADNHQLVHGRRGFTKDSPRHLRRIQIL
jgi:alpha-ketoglutarate-dependent taurine dioxygenase